MGRTDCKAWNALRHSRTAVGGATWEWIRRIISANNIKCDLENRCLLRPRSRWKSPLATAVSGSSTLETRLSTWLSRSEEHTSELQSLAYLVCRLLLEKKNKN